eukprot:TRINITY_DN17358_c0_g1_i1.p1 TRINITY_DN17358_c0_g1~~TRINITY_DN17358_c0_g1_i1.p1  ORF type:complete len:787 (+),score=202.29 TRINITY_DN17358_c0_g1_i1:206-2566(+)
MTNLFSLSNESSLFRKDSNFDVDDDEQERRKKRKWKKWEKEKMKWKEELEEERHLWEQEVEEQLRGLDEERQILQVWREEKRRWEEEKTTRVEEMKKIRELIESNTTEWVRKKAAFIEELDDYEKKRIENQKEFEELAQWKLVRDKLAAERERERKKWEAEKKEMDTEKDKERMRREREFKRWERESEVARERERKEREDERRKWLSDFQVAQEITRAQWESETRKWKEKEETWKKLKAQHKLWHDQRSKWGDVVRVNIGGEIFTTTKGTLNGYSSLFRVIFSEQNARGDNNDSGEGTVFIDRDPKLFRHLLNFLRTSSFDQLPTCRKIRRELLHEAEFYQIEKLVNFLQIQQKPFQKSGSDGVLKSGRRDIPIEERDVDWVARWLDEMGFGDIAERFVDEEIDGRALLLLTPDELRDEFSTLLPLGRRKNLLYRIDHLRQENNEYLSNPSLSSSLSSSSTSLSNNARRVKLNVGGKIYSTTIETLTKVPNTFFSIMFSGKYETKPSAEDNSYWIDRDGERFGYILNYLRDYDLPLPNDPFICRQLLVESRFYQIDGLLEKLEECIYNYEHSLSTEAETPKFQWDPHAVSPQIQLSQDLVAATKVSSGVGNHDDDNQEDGTHPQKQLCSFIRMSPSVKRGIVYVEVAVDKKPNFNCYWFGVVDVNFTGFDDSLSDADVRRSCHSWLYEDNGNLCQNGSYQPHRLEGFEAGDVLGMLINMTDRSISLYRNRTFLALAFHQLPSELFPVFCLYNESSQVTILNPLPFPLTSFIRPPSSPTLFPRSSGS